MAAKTFYIQHSNPVTGTALSGGTLKDADTGSAPSTATTATGWTVDALDAPNYARMVFGGEIASSSFASSAQPSSGPFSDDWFRSENPLDGTMAAGTWNIALSFIGVTLGGAIGAPRIRFYRGSNAGGGYVQIGSGTTELTATAGLNTSTADNLTGTLVTVATTVFNTAQYLYMQLAWRVTGAALSTADVRLRTDGTNSVIVSPEFTPNPSGRTLGALCAVPRPLPFA